MSDFSGILDDLYDDGEENRDQQPAAPPAPPAEEELPADANDDIAEVLASWGPAAEAEVPVAPAPPPPPAAQPTVAAPDAPSRDLDDDLAAALSAALADDPVSGPASISNEPLPAPSAPGPVAQAPAPAEPDPWLPAAEPVAEAEPSPWAAPESEAVTAVPAPPPPPPPASAEPEWVTVAPVSDAPLVPAPAVPAAGWSRGADDILPGAAAGKSKSSSPRGRKAKAAPVVAEAPVDSEAAFFGPDQDQGAAYPAPAEGVAPPPPPPADYQAPVAAQPADAAWTPAPAAPPAEPPPPTQKQGRFGTRTRIGPRDFGTRKR